MYSFTWDLEKNNSNITKHGIAFEEACMVFLDENAILFDDPDHSAEEERYNILGLTDRGRLCIVSHCYRNNDSEIRIISARKANTSERATYYKYSTGGLDYER